MRMHHSLTYSKVCPEVRGLENSFRYRSRRVTDKFEKLNIWTSKYRKKPQSELFLITGEQLNRWRRDFLIIGTNLSFSDNFNSAQLSLFWKVNTIQALQLMKWRVNVEGSRQISPLGRAHWKREEKSRWGHK